MSNTTGVYYRATRKRWIARININGKEQHVGSYLTKKAAADARSEAMSMLNRDISGKRASCEKALPVKSAPATENTINGGFDLEDELSKRTVADLKRQVRALTKNKLTMEEVRKCIFELRDAEVDIPDWLVDAEDKESIHGVPTLLLSDWHMGEVVQPENTFGKNEYSMDIAAKRIRILARNTIDILKNHLKSDYEGMVLLLAGDFVSGTIHEELLITNEKPIMPIVVRTYELLVWFIKQMQDLVGNVQLFCVHGNHGRTFKKPIFKDSALSSYDWLIYTMLEKYFEDDPTVNFQISPVNDLQYKVYGMKYRLSHGHDFRGGQGFLGAMAPVTRGEMKKRAAAQSYGEDYDRLIIGHFHTYQTLSRVTVNGSLIGYNDFAIGNGYNFERPQQAMWLTHPIHGLTFSCPIFCTESELPSKASWVSWEDKK